MANRLSSYSDMNNYPANPYIKAPVIGPRTPAPAPAQPATGLQPGPIPTPDGSGYWTGPEANAGAWSGQAFSPEFNQARQGMYGWFNNAMQNQPSLAGMYEGYLKQNPLLEQTAFNQALSRLKGQYGTAMRGLTTQAGAMRGGNRSGSLLGGIEDLNRQLMGGTMDIATQQAMNNLADQERRQQQLIGYTGQDITNRMGMGQAMQGWLGQMFPVEQYGINAPYERAMAEEQMNAARRNEGMGWLNALTGYQNALANQYYQGQGNWLGYTGMRGQNILGGYTPNWLGWTQAYM